MSKPVRKALEQEAKKTENEKLRILAEEAGQILHKIPEDELLRSIRESREAP